MATQFQPAADFAPEQSGTALLTSRPIRPQRELVRPRLALPESLRTGQIGLATFFAPAGYGKSTVMAAWRDTLEADGAACCWLHLREHHRDPKALLHALLNALQQQAPKLSFERTERNLPSATSYNIEPLLSSLIEELIESDHRVVLFLDDLENVANSPGDKALALLLEHRPANVSLVLGSRNARQFSLTQYRLAGQIVELRTQDLSFTEDEIKTLFLDHFHIKMKAESLTQLAIKTEGWPAALSLFALASQNTSNPDESLRNFTNATGELADYLGEVLLKGLNPQTQDLLMRAAVPDSFTIELLQQLVPDQDATAALDQISQASLFLRAEDSQGLELRFHSLCGSFLRRRLQQSNPALYRDLLAVTGHWYWTHNRLYDAVNCAKSAEEWTLMAERISDVAETMVRGYGELDTYLEWLRDLPEAVLKTYPQLFLHQAWALCFSRQIKQAEIALDRLNTLLRDLPPEQEHNFRRQMELYSFFIDSMDDRAHLTLQKMQDWLRHYPDAPDVERALALGTLASAARHRAKYDLALTSLEESENVFQKIKGDYSLAWIHNIRLPTLIRNGNFVDARVRGYNGLSFICETLGEQSPHAGMSNAMLAYLAYEKGDISKAGEHLENGMRFFAKHGVVDSLYFAHVTQSCLAADDGNEPLAQAILLEGEQHGVSLQLPRLTIQLAMRRALRLLYAGDHTAADALIHSRQLLVYPSDTHVEVREHCATLLRINMDLLKGKFREAADSAKVQSKAAAATNSLRVKAEYDFLLVIALQNAGELNEAARRFHELLALAAVQERHRFMLHFGSLGRGLISAQYKTRQEAWNSGVEPDAADRILKELVNASGLLKNDSPAEKTTGFVEGLTNREIDILQRASRTGLNNKKLAEVLFVSEGTLKWHLHNIYSKLEVRNRAGAIAQAQRMGLLH